MNTIEIYLTSVGENEEYEQDFSFAELIKDFPIYQYNYQNIVLNINIPTSIIPSGYEIAGQTTNTMGVAVKVDASSLARNGKIRQSKAFYLRYLKTWTKNNVEYAMFQRPFPQTFALYAGEGENAPKLTINVVNIMNDTLEDPNPTVVSIITSQTCSLEIMPSTILDKDEPLDPSDLDEINARLNTLDDEIQVLGGTPFTNETLGLIKGSTDNGKISANEDGTGSVSGWETKLNTNLGGTNAGKYLQVDNSGNIVPVNVDFENDVVEGYYYNDRFYADAQHEQMLIGERGKIYIDLVSNREYRYDGTNYVVLTALIDDTQESSTTTYSSQKIGNTFVFTVNYLTDDDVDDIYEGE